jgi:hypothetical protein
VGFSSHVERAPGGVNPEHGGTASPTFIQDLVQLVGDRVLILHAPSTEGLSGGGDIDCAVSGLDPWWPLRLGLGWRLCQFSQYDLCGWSWVLERDGELLHVDTLDDPRGLGRDGVPTALLEQGDEMEASPPLRAAYLAVKRLRKGDRTEAEWARIHTIAAKDWEAFRSALRTLAGGRLGGTLYESVREGQLPDDRQWRRARVLQVLRRFRTPSRALAATALQTNRVIQRALHPPGWSVLIVGPDGAGKSTLAGTLGVSLTGVFREASGLHWRPGILPRPGAILGRGQADPARPHGRPPHGRALSLALLGYFWLDFFVGGWLRLWPTRLRTVLVVTERGWWDLAVDPRRYRLDVPSWLVRALGSLLPRPDAAFVLEGSAKALRERKAELPEEELDRQRAAWRKTLPRGVPTISLDASLPPREVAGRAREETLRMLEKRAARRLGAGWDALRWRGQIRWWLPRGSPAAAAGALSIYQPVTVRGRLGWEAARIAARAGAFRLLPRGEAPPSLVRRALAPHLPPRTTLAVARANHPGRYVAAILDGRGICHGLAKVATGPAGTEALRREAEAIERIGSLLTPPLAAPRVLVHEPGVLLLEAVPWRPRPRPWGLEPKVARALGMLFASKTAAGRLEGPAHGDCAPWNLLQTDQGWVLIDWEDATDDAPPFHDLCHYLVQGYTLLGRPSWSEVREGFLHGAGWVGRAVRAYAEGSGVAADRAPRSLESYLRGSHSRMEAEGELAGSEARLRILKRFAT